MGGQDAEWRRYRWEWNIAFGTSLLLDVPLRGVILDGHLSKAYRCIDVKHACIDQ
jgi:hypothetical protein